MIKKILLWLHQLPQHILACIILSMNNKKDIRISTFDNGKIKVYFVEKGVFKCGISLGNYIILHKKYYDRGMLTVKTAKHEYGHSIQSRYFGWFYLIFIGLPSITNNIISRIYKKDEVWYYNRYPEKWADDLGEVHRWDS